MPPPQVDTFTGDRCPLLMTSATAGRRQLRGLVADAAKMGEAAFGTQAAFVTRGVGEEHESF